MRLSTLISLVFLLISSCNQGQDSKKNALPLDIHEVTVKEVLQTSSYSYLKVIESGSEFWIALPKQDISVGKTYYYKNGFKLTEFESKELKRKFEVIYFVESISSSADLLAKDTLQIPANSYHHVKDTSIIKEYSAKVKVEKEEIAPEVNTTGLTIAEIFASKNKYEGKNVRIKGKVTKYNPKIMGSNWIHLQDGTEFNGKFDLTATTALEFQVGTTVFLEGTIRLNKDFGYGYSYEVLLENASIVGE